MLIVSVGSAVVEGVPTEGERDTEAEGDSEELVETVVVGLKEAETEAEKDAVWDGVPTDRL